MRGGIRSIGGAICAAILTAALLGCGASAKDTDPAQSADISGDTTSTPIASLEVTDPIVQQPEQQSEAAQQPEQQSEAAQLDIAQQTDQNVIVHANQDTTCHIALHEKVDGAWQCTIEDEGIVGADGVGQTSEYLQMTPQGTFGLGFAFGNDVNPGTQMEYRQVTPDAYWVDDPSSAYYNQWVYADQVECDWNSAEHLADAPNSYRYAVFIQYNVDPVVPGAGSAFFLHCYSNSGSWGCIQTSQDTMRQILCHLRDGAMIVIDG